MKYFLNRYILLIAVGLMQLATAAQSDTLTLNYKLQRYLRKCEPQQLYDFLHESSYTTKDILSIGKYMSYHSHDGCGNALQKICFAKMDTINADDYHEYSVQNTKNGNYAEAIAALEKAVALDAQNIEGYYGWVLLYYYRDYARSLKHLNHYDQLKPNEMKAPVGENIHFLKGLCYYQMRDFDKAISEFTLNLSFETKKFGIKYANAYIFFYLGRCYDQLGDLKKAGSYYEKAITYTLFPTEAHYYLGLLRRKEGKVSIGQRHLESSLSLIKSGYKQQDIYVELFDEVYQSQIEEALIIK